MTDHGKCTTCGRDMHPASRYGGLCWECHDAAVKKRELRREAKMLEQDAEIRVLRAALKGTIEALTWLDCTKGGRREAAKNVAKSVVESGDASDAEAEIIRRIFDE